MRSFIAFFNKELLELKRSNKLIILFIIFIIFGIMNPAIAKLTPWMMEMFADTLAESGMSINEIKVDALTSWTQFYKNVPMTLIIFVLMFSSILTNEYQKNTLIPILTKGLARWKVICSKTLMMVLIWSLGFILCFGITYTYNSFFWDNSIASNIFTAALLYWLFGIWIISLITLFSSLASTNSSVLLGTGGCVILIYVLSIIPSLTKYLPLKLCEGMTILNNQVLLKSFTISTIIVTILIIFNTILSILCFNKKKI